MMDPSHWRSGVDELLVGMSKDALVSSARLLNLSNCPAFCGQKRLNPVQVASYSVCTPIALCLNKLFFFASPMRIISLEGFICSVCLVVSGYYGLTSAVVISETQFFISFAFRNHISSLSRHLRVCLLLSLSPLFWIILWALEFVMWAGVGEWVRERASVGSWEERGEEGHNS